MWLKRLILRRESGCRSRSRDFNRAASAMKQFDAAAARSMSSASGKPVIGQNFDGGLLSSDGGVLALREVEQRLRGRRSARRLHDRSSRGRSDHAQLDGRHPFSTADDQRTPATRTATAANTLRRDPIFKMALDLSPIDREFVLAVDRQYRGWKRSAGRSRRAADGAGRWSIYRYCRSFATVPHQTGSRWTSTTRSMRSTVVSELRRCSTPTTTNTGFQPIVVFDNEEPLRHRRALSRQAAERQGDRSLLPEGACCAAIRALTGRAPRSCCRKPTATIAVPRFSIGVAPMASITSSASRQPRHCATMSKVSKPAARRRDSRPRRGAIASFVVSWSSSTARKAGAGSSGSSPASKRALEGPDYPLRRHQSEQPQQLARALRGCLLPPARPGRKPYQVLEDFHLWRRADRTSCSRATANSVSAVPACGRLLADVGPTRYCRCPKRSMWRVAQFDTLRLRLIKIAARVIEMKTMIRVHLPTSCPAQDIPTLRSGTHTAPRHMTDGA